ncbi:MAG: hypothetical protein WCK98_03975 [bacterium]
MLSNLHFDHDELSLFRAGSPGYPGNFSRDSLIAGFLFEDPGIIKDQLIFCAQQQGDKTDSFTGEEPGKIHHEIPEISMRGHTTRYAACDTTALFILGHKKYLELTGDHDLLKIQKDHILAAFEYIQKHTKNGLFWESPSYSGATTFALKVTYWKDSQIIHRPNHQPAYPICYTLTQVQNLAAMRFLRDFVKVVDAEKLAQEMIDAFKEKMYNEQSGQFLLARDELGEIIVETSDTLHMLYYLEVGDLNQSQVDAVIKTSGKLLTTHGFRTMIANQAEKVESYHSKTVWPFEQAIIHSGATKFGLTQIALIAARVYKYLKTEPEFFILDDQGQSLTKGGCDPQLWTVSSKHYFSKIENKINSA